MKIIYPCTAKQDYKCKICKRHADELKKGLVVDHDHKTGKCRALYALIAIHSYMFRK
jgi:hypothetical protein